MDESKITVTLKMPFQAMVDLATVTFRDHGFAVALPIDLQSTFRERLGIVFRPYVLLRLHHEALVLRALALSPRAGAVTSCSVAIQGMEDGVIEVTVLDPFAALVAAASVDQAETPLIASEMQEKLVAAMEDLHRRAVLSAEARDAGSSARVPKDGAA